MCAANVRTDPQSLLFLVPPFAFNSFTCTLSPASLSGSGAPTLIGGPESELAASVTVLAGSVCVDAGGGRLGGSTTSTGGVWCVGGVCCGGRVCLVCCAGAV